VTNRETERDLAQARYDGAGDTIKSVFAHFDEARPEPNA
jgi:hypothetical protein